MCILLSMILNATYMLWCMHVSIILWFSTRKPICVLGPLILEKHLSEGWNFHEILEASCCADLESNLDIFGWNWHWNPNTMSKHQTTMTQTVSRDSPKRRKCRRHIWNCVMCCQLFHLHDSHFRQMDQKHPGGLSCQVHMDSYGFICRKEIRHRSKRTSELQKVISTCHAHRRGIIMCLADGPDRGSRRKGS